jgi:hypothetical protein
MAMKVAMSENSASRSDQTASRDIGSSIMRRRTMDLSDLVPVAPAGLSHGVVADLRRHYAV